MHMRDLRNAFGGTKVVYDDLENLQYPTARMLTGFAPRSLDS